MNLDLLKKRNVLLVATFVLLIQQVLTVPAAWSGDIRFSDRRQGANNVTSSDIARFARSEFKGSRDVRLVSVTLSAEILGIIVNPEYAKGKLLEQQNEIIEYAFGKVFKSLKAPANVCLLYTSPSPRDLSTSRMPSSA